MCLQITLMAAIIKLYVLPEIMSTSLSVSYPVSLSSSLSHEQEMAVLPMCLKKRKSIKKNETKNMLYYWIIMLFAIQKYPHTYHSGPISGFSSQVVRFPALEMKLWK